MENDEGFLNKLKQYFGFSEPRPPMLGLENKIPYNSNDASFYTSDRYGMRYKNGEIIGVKEGYWDDINRIRGVMVMPKGYEGNLDGPLALQNRTNRLVYPDEVPFRPSPLGGTERNPYVNSLYGGPAEPLFVNGMVYPQRPPVEKNPEITEQRRVIRFNTPEEKAAYLLAQAERAQVERNLRLPVPATDASLATKTMLSTDRIPYFGDYRAGQAVPDRPYMTSGQMLRYYPEYLKDPRISKELALQGSKAVQSASVLLSAYDALNRREANFTDFYDRKRRDPTDMENLELRVQSGLEPVLNAVTFGVYDALAETPTYKAQEADFYRANQRRKEIQAGVDYPMVGGQRVERTTR